MRAELSRDELRAIIDVVRLAERVAKISDHYPEELAWLRKIKDRFEKSLSRRRHPRQKPRRAKR